MDDRLKEVQTTDLTDSRVNHDFTDWLKTKGMNWLLAILLVACAFLGWDWYKRKQIAAKDQAWAELEAATSPAAYQGVATTHKDTGAIAEIAMLQAGDALLRYLLLIDEEILEDPITGVGGFTEHFQKQGPFDDQGRSLRQLNLRKYLFEYPCSYLIYSESFDAMPGPMLDYVYRRLYDILTGRDRDAPFDAISTAKRRAVLEILRQTKSSLPVYFFKD